jgi:hypothetical protein
MKSFVGKSLLRPFKKPKLFFILNPMWMRFYHSKESFIFEVTFPLDANGKCYKVRQEDTYV